MEKQKHHIFSARTTDEGLRMLNELKTKLGIGWDELVLDAVCAHYGLDRATMVLPKREKPAKEEGSSSEETQTDKHKQAKKEKKGRKAKAAVQEG